MLKKFSALFLGLALVGCSTSSNVNHLGGADASSTDFSEITLSEKSNFRVGVLLPLTGDAARYGNGLKNATMLALEDVKNPNLILQYYDTKSSTEGARTAVQNALNQNVQMIIGPLKSSSVRAISDETTRKNIPVIAFSTTEDVLQPSVYTLGLLVDEQVNRIISYAVKKGRSRLALLVPDNATGIAVAKAAVKAAKKNSIVVTRIAFYPPNTSDFSNILSEMTDYNTRHARMEKLKASLKAKADAGDAESAKALRRVSTHDTLGEIDFDMVLIPEKGAQLKSAVAMFGYYDVFAPDVKFLGTSLWENSKLNNESTIVGSWYPAISRSHSNYFVNKYSYVFGERPQALYALGYDAVALANAIARQGGNNPTTVITNPDGYVGINGMFRLFENGRNQHSMDIVEVKKTGDVVIDQAPSRFDAADVSAFTEEVDISETYRAPLIFGKDKTLAESLIYGHKLNLENQEDLYEAEERDSIRRSLQKMNIMIGN